MTFSILDANALSKLIILIINFNSNVVLVLGKRFRYFRISFVYVLIICINQAIANEEDI